MPAWLTEAAQTAPIERGRRRREADHGTGRQAQPTRREGTRRQPGPTGRHYPVPGTGSPTG